MPIHEEYSDVLQNLEQAVISVYRDNPEMTDYVAQRAYEVAYEHYRAEQRGYVPKPAGLSGLNAVAHDAVCAICEFRLGGGPGPNPEGPAVEPIRQRASSRAFAA